MDITDERAASISVARNAARLMGRGLCKRAFNYLCSQRGPNFAFGREFDRIVEIVYNGSRLS